MCAPRYALNVAESVAKTLRAYGTDYFFLLTGGDQPLWYAIRDAGIKLVLARSEQAAVYMADGYARISYKPGFVYGQFGPGAANVAAGMADPFWASSPVVALTSCMSTVGRYKREYQELDQLSMFSSTTKWNGYVTTPTRAAELLRTAIRVAIGGSPGPTHLEIPYDFMRQDIGAPEIYADAQFKSYPALRTSPDYSRLAGAIDLLLRAERPIILAGTGVILSQAWDEVVEIAELLSIPVATSMGGKGTIPENHPLAVGVVGRYSRKSANEIMARTDLAVVVGSRLGGLVTDGLKIPLPSTRIIHIDISPDSMCKNFKEEFPILGDAKLVLRAMINGIKEKTQRPSNHAWLEEVKKLTQDWRSRFESLASKTLKPLRPEAVVKILRETMKKDDILVADTGYMGAWTGALFDVFTSGRTFLRAAGSLGWAFPASLGAKLAAPDKNVICVTGDGGIGYHIPEMETAVRLGIPTVTVVLNNRSLGFEYHDQKYSYGSFVNEVLDFTDIDYGRVAAAFGGQGHRAETAGEFREAITRALTSGKPTLIDVRIDKDAVAPTTYYEKAVQRL